METQDSSFFISYLNLREVTPLKQHE